MVLLSLNYDTYFRFVGAVLCARHLVEWHVIVAHPRTAMLFALPQKPVQDTYNTVE